MSGHGITWDMVRRGTTDDLAEGVTWVSPGLGTAYRTTDADGSVEGVGWLELDGTAWTVHSLENGVVTARSHDGRITGGPLPAGHPILILRESSPIS
jgi:hypothetical protein